MFVQDGLALFFKRIFLAAAFFVVLMAVEFRDRIASGIGEFYVLVLLALAGMMFAASANDLVMVYVALEMMSVSFYVLVSFQRSRSNSLEAGVKYLILSGVSAAVLVFGIALIFGAAGGTNFAALSAAGAAPGAQPGLFARRAAGAAGVGLQNRLLPHADVGAGRLPGGAHAGDGLPGHRLQGGGIRPGVARAFRGRARALGSLGQAAELGGGADHSLRQPLRHPATQLETLAGLFEHRQRRLPLLGVAALNAAGAAAVLYYLAGYAFTLAAAFVVLCIVARDSDDIAVLAGLNRRSPLAGRLAHAGHGFAGGRAAAGWIPGQIPSFQGRHPASRRMNSRLSLADGGRAGRRGHFPLLLFWRHPRHLLVQGPGRPLPHRRLDADESLPGPLHRRHALPGTFPGASSGPARRRR